MDYKVEVLTGIRPTGSLTLANYLGAVVPVVDLQDQGKSPLVFVADLHALTDNEPSEVRKYVNEVVADYIALGLDPKKTNIYRQFDIAGQVTTLSALLARHVKVAELLRVPTLKEKLKGKRSPENANTLLFLYPVIMAADILINRAKLVPVGEDQVAHLEVTRDLANRFNKNFGKVFPLPRVLQVKSLRILSLRGKGKMSKSNPGGAIFLTDDPDTIKSKIKGAETAVEGEMNEKLESHILIARGMVRGKEELMKLDELIERHKKGERVMVDFKDFLSEIVVRFVREFQEKRAMVVSDPDLVSSVLEAGKKRAIENAEETLAGVIEAIGF